MSERLVTEEILFAHPDKQELDAIATAVLFEHLTKTEAYGTNAPIHKYVTSRVETLCGDDTPPLVVVCKAPNSRGVFTAPGLVVIDDGFIEFLDYQEELDGALSHELTHDARGHYGRRNAESKSEFGKIGITRFFESEADILGMRLMDQHGINPAGMVSLFEKIASDPSMNAASMSHGRASDRKINLEQLLWFIDARHLSDDFTPMQLMPDEYDSVASATKPEFSVTVERMVQQHTILQRANNTVGVDPDLISRQVALLSVEQSDPVVVDLQAKSILASSNSAYVEQVITPSTTILDIDAVRHALEQPNVRQTLGKYTDHFSEKIFEYFIATLIEDAAKSGSPISDQHAAEIVNYADSHDMHESIMETVRYAVQHAAPVDIRLTSAAKIYASSSLPSGRIIDESSLDPLAVAGHIEHRHKYILMHNSVSEVRAANAKFHGGSLVDSLVYAACYGEHADLIDGIYIASDLAIKEYESWDLQTDLIKRAFSDSDMHTQSLEQDEASDGYEYDDQYNPTLQYEDDVDDMHDESLQMDGHALAGFAAALRTEVSNTSPDNLATMLTEAVMQGNLSLEQAASAARVAIDIYENINYKDKDLNLLSLYVLVNDQSATAKKINELCLLRIGDAFQALEHSNDNYNAPASVKRYVFVNVDDSDTVAETLRQLTDNVNIYDLKSESQLLNTLERVLADISLMLKAAGVIDVQIHGESDACLGQEMLNECVYLKQLTLIHAMNVFVRDSDAKPLIDMLDSVVPPRINDGGIYAVPDFGALANTLWHRAVERILVSKNPIGNPQYLAVLAILGISADDVEVNLTVPSKAIALLADRRKLSGALTIVTDRFAHLPGIYLQDAIEVIIERKAQTIADFELINRHIERIVNRLAATHQTGIAVATAIDTHIIERYRTLRKSERQVGIKTDHVVGLESSRLMRALLLSGQDDRELKRYIAERWWLANRSHPDLTLQEKFRVEEYATLRYPHKRARLQWWLDHDNPSTSQYQPLENVLNHLYLSSRAARYAAVRSLMLGEGGVLTDREGKENLVTGLMDSWVTIDSESSDGILVTDLLVNVLVGNPDDRVYQYVSPILQDMILRPPQAQHPTSGVASDIAATVLEDMKSRRILVDQVDHDQRIVALKIERLMRGNTGGATARDQVHENLTRLFARDDQMHHHKLSLTGLSLLVGKQSGALGTRMLQLAGQYFDIPEDEKADFAEVYDNMRGQSRIQAYNTLRREAQYSPEVTNLISEIASFGERLGGGSLVTVYGITLKDGTKEVLGIRNPNAEHHVRRVADLYHTGVQLTANAHSDATHLALLDTLLEDAVIWIRDELNDTDFDRKDSVFRAENDTTVTTTTTTNFRQGRTKYTVRVPSTKPTGTPWIRREEFVDGKNLNGLTVTDTNPTDIPAGLIHRDDFKQAVSLLVRNYAHQLQRGSYAHSDIHGGNFRVSTDNSQLVVFDRYNLIRMTDDLRKTVKNILNGAIGGNFEQIAQSVVQYSTKEDVNVNLAQANQSLTEVIRQTSQDPAQAVTQITLALKKSGIRVPIELGLIIRNIFGLSSLSQKAGFNGIVDAFLHTADEQELQLLQ